MCKPVRQMYEDKFIKVAAACGAVNISSECPTRERARDEEEYKHVFSFAREHCETSSNLNSKPTHTIDDARAKGQESTRLIENDSERAKKSSMSTHTLTMWGRKRKCKSALFWPRSTERELIRSSVSTHTLTMWGQKRKFKSALVWSRSTVSEPRRSSMSTHTSIMRGRKENWIERSTRSLPPHTDETMITWRQLKEMKFSPDDESPRWIPKKSAGRWIARSSTPQEKISSKCDGVAFVADLLGGIRRSKNSSVSDTLTRSWKIPQNIPKTKDEGLFESKELLLAVLTTK